MASNHELGLEHGEVEEEEKTEREEGRADGEEELDGRCSVSRLSAHTL